MTIHLQPRGKGHQRLHQPDTHVEKRTLQIVSNNLAPGTSTTKTRSTKPETNKAKHNQSKETSDGFTSLITPYLQIN